MHATSSFVLDSNVEDPASVFEYDCVHSNQMRIEKTFTGDLAGRGSVNMLSVRGATGAGYVALERINGTLHGRRGGFSLLHIGTLVGSEQWARWPIVAGSGTGELRTIRGEARIDIDAQGNHTFTIDYQLD